MKTTDNNATQTELECQAAAFRRLVSHLQNRTDVQNIEHQFYSADEKQEISLTKEEAREIIYGMPYSEWKKNYQTESNPDNT